jgi:hypothetical protein
MTGKQLKAWAATVHDDATIEVHRYAWDTLEIDKVRAIWISSPSREMQDVCNAEQVSS